MNQKLKMNSGDKITVNGFIIRAIGAPLGEPCGDLQISRVNPWHEESAKLEKVMTREIAEFLRALKNDIEDDFRASDDSDDNTPGMQVTVSTDDLQSWNYQTGDNSYAGACYGDAHWSVIYLYRCSNCNALASEAVSELAGQVAEAHELNPREHIAAGYGRSEIVFAPSLGVSTVGQYADCHVEETARKANEYLQKSAND